MESLWIGYGGLLEFTCTVLLNIFFSGHLADSEGDLGDSDRELEEVKNSFVKIIQGFII